MARSARRDVRLRAAVFVEPAETTVLEIFSNLTRFVGFSWR